ncbi:MAG: hypothetical protein IPL61_36695 [Myxococcales bacterium]|nr:hypothetical protein [Myxococcales bacterium]
MIRVAWFVTAVALLAPVAAQAAPPTGDPASAVVGPHAADWTVLDPSVRRGFAVPPPGSPPQPPPAEHAVVSNIIYVNRCVGGCRITKSAFPNSSSLNNSTWIGGDIPTGSQFMLSEFAYGQPVWDEFLTCLKDVYAPYNVQIVETDPSPAAHHEAIVAGFSREAMLADGILGQAELGAGFCAPKDNAISFNFANDHTGIAGLTIAQNLCWTVAQETAHSWGLDHEFDCTDALTYIPTCGQKYFRNKPAPCGENAERPCVCGGVAQNSHGKILAVFGQGTGPQLEPTLRIDQPADGATFPAGNSVFVTASSQRGLKRVELYVNGWKWVEKPGTAGTVYQIALPTEVPDGVMELKVRACDDIDVCAEQAITVTRGAPCTSEATCLGGQRCDAGKCLWDPPTVALGGGCEFDQQCLSLLCGDAGTGDLICTQACQGPPNDLCPDGFSCGAGPGEAGVCAPDGGPGDDGGCCSVDGSSGAPLVVNLGLGGLIGLVIARRRRKR